MMLKRAAHRMRAKDKTDTLQAPSASPVPFKTCIVLYSAVFLENCGAGIEKKENEKKNEMREMMEMG